MPAMIRPDGKASEIAYNILGTPGNGIVRKKKKVKTEEPVKFEEESRIR